MFRPLGPLLSRHLAPENLDVVYVRLPVVSGSVLEGDRSECRWSYIDWYLAHLTGAVGIAQLGCLQDFVEPWGAPCDGFMDFDFIISSSLVRCQAS